MNVIIDAQIVHGYFMEATLADEDDNPILPPTGLTGKATEIFDRMGSQDRAFLDEDGQIQHEWGSVVDPEWFDPWLAEMLNNRSVIEIPVENCPQLRKQLMDVGFPARGSRDIWYIRTAKCVVSLFGRQVQNTRQPVAFIISEDMHFHEPSETKRVDSQRRLRILRSGTGSVPRCLKHERISVNCIQSYLEMVSS